MHPSLSFQDLDENLFQGILVVSSTPKVTSSEWLNRIIENSKNKSNLEFQPVLENGIKTLRFDTCLSTNNQKLSEPIRCHCAMLDNKYYTTQIYLVELEKPMEFPERFYDFIHGIIIYLDNNDEHCLRMLDKWTQYIDLMENCAIKILSCENASEKSVVKKIDIQNYCIDKGFELVELIPETEQNQSNTTGDNGTFDDDQELEDDFQEMNSFERLYKAIQAYVWPNLNYKEKHSSSYISSTPSDTLIKQINRLNFTDNESFDIPHRKLEDTTNSNTTNPETLNNSTLQQQRPENSMQQSNPVTEQDAEKFETMFSKFNEMKEKASLLEDEERKRYAEQVAIAFWNSINDDQDEVLFSSDEEGDKERDSDPNHVYV